MDIYKEINKGLVMQNQNLKMQTSALQKEVILLRNELMDEHYRRVIGEKKLKSLLVDNFRKAMVALEPDCNLLELLKIEDCDDDDKFDGSYGAVATRCPEKLKNSQILKELRRSNSLQRRSSIMASPTRRSSCAMSIADKISFQPVESNDLSDEADKFENAESDMSLTPGIKSNNFDYFEVGNDDIKSDVSDESDKEEVEKNEEEGQEEPASTSRNIQNLSFISEEELPSKDLEDELLRDNAESSEDEELQQDKENIQLTQYSNKLPTSELLRQVRVEVAQLRIRSPLQDSSNYIINTNVEKATKSKPQASNVVVRRGRRCSYNNVSDNSIEKVRVMNSQQEEQIDIAEVNISKEQPTLELGTTINTFNGLSITRCSTPNNLEENKDGEKSNNESSTRTHLKRSCQPKCLGEPSLMTKLRNETQVASDKRSKSRRKRK